MHDVPQMATYTYRDVYGSHSRLLVCSPVLQLSSSP